MSFSKLAWNVFAASSENRAFKTEQKHKNPHDSDMQG